MTLHSIDLSILKQYVILVDVLIFYIWYYVFNYKAQYYLLKV